MPVANIPIALPSHVFEDTDWKFQHKLKYDHRDAGRRSTGNRADPHLKHHQQRTNAMRLEKHPLRPRLDKTARRNISEQLRHSAATLSNRTSLSWSEPSATSWPPALSSSAEAINLHPLASSAPSTCTVRENEHRRETRPMTLFESARIFNESGQLLSHDSFNKLGSPLHIIDGRNLKRKFKRRVGRRKHETRRTVDVLNADEVVLELMCLLFPNVEITQELNILLLGGAQHEDVFHFDEDETIGVPATELKHSKLDINLLRFQAALAAMLFNSDNLIQRTPARGTPAESLQKIYFTPEWIAREMLAIIKLDIFFQYDRVAVMSTIFRSIPTLRPSILAAAASTSLAIFQHQSLANFVPGDDGKGHVIVKGMIAFLEAALNVIERDTQFNTEVFGKTDNEICDAIRELCSQITRSIRLLVRSSPGGRRNSDFSCNQLEKYAECSNSVEATTYRTIGELVKRMTSVSPTHGENFLRWMLLKWPQRNVQLQVFFLRFTAGLLSHFMLLGLMLPADIVHRTFMRIRACIQSQHFLVAQEACIMCTFQLICVHLSGDQFLREKIASALHANASSHWNKRIREISDEYFDMMLDLA